MLRIEIQRKKNHENITCHDFMFLAPYNRAATSENAETVSIHPAGE
jgi:hypothetical protein